MIKRNNQLIRSTSVPKFSSNYIDHSFQLQNQQQTYTTKDLYEKIKLSYYLKIIQVYEQSYHYLPDPQLIMNILYKYNDQLHVKQYKLPRCYKESPPNGMKLFQQFQHQHIVKNKKNKYSIQPKQEMFLLKMKMNSILAHLGINNEKLSLLKELKQDIDIIQFFIDQIQGKIQQIKIQTNGLCDNNIFRKQQAYIQNQEQQSVQPQNMQLNKLCIQNMQCKAKIKTILEQLNKNEEYSCKYQIRFLAKQIEKLLSLTEKFQKNLHQISNVATQKQIYSHQFKQFMINESVKWKNTLEREIEKNIKMEYLLNQKDDKIQYLNELYDNAIKQLRNIQQEADNNAHQLHLLAAQKNNQKSFNKFCIDAQIKVIQQNQKLKQTINIKQQLHQKQKNQLQRYIKQLQTDLTMTNKPQYDDKDFQISLQSFNKNLEKIAYQWKQKLKETIQFYEDKLSQRLNNEKVLIRQIQEIKMKPKSYRYEVPANSTQIHSVQNQSQSVNFLKQQSSKEINVPLEYI